MQNPDDAILSELEIGEWLEAYEHISASAVGKRGPVRPGAGKVYDSGSRALYRLATM